MPKGKRTLTPKQAKKENDQPDREAEADASVVPDVAAEDFVEEKENEEEDNEEADDDVEVSEGEETQEEKDKVTPRRRNNKRRRSFYQDKPVSTSKGKRMLTLKQAKKENDQPDTEAEADASVEPEVPDVTAEDFVEDKDSEEEDNEEADDDVEVSEGEETEEKNDKVTLRRRNNKGRRSFYQDKPVSTPSSIQREKKEVKLAGMIFLCSDVTKKDCFKYDVFGLPENKKDLVDQVKRGMKLFLYNIDRKHLCGIYQATLGSGMNLVPEAFRGKFPAQVRFRVLKDCIPLKESEFKEAIKDNYVHRGRFKTELSSEQVHNLMQLFRPLDSDDVPQPRNNQDTPKLGALRDARRGRDSRARGLARGSRDLHAGGYARHVPRPAPPEPIRHIPRPVSLEPMRDVTSLYAREHLPAAMDHHRTQPAGYISATSQIALAEAEGRQRYLDNLYLEQTSLIGSSFLPRDPLNRGAEYQREMPLYSRGAEYQREMPLYSSYTGPQSLGWPY